jgi:hypothetical protein
MKRDRNQRQVRVTELEKERCVIVVGSRVGRDDGITVFECAGAIEVDGKCFLEMTQKSLQGFDVVFHVGNPLVGDDTSYGQLPSGSTAGQVCCKKVAHRGDRSASQSWF